MCVLCDVKKTGLSVAWAFIFANNISTAEKNSISAAYRSNFSKLLQFFQTAPVSIPPSPTAIWFEKISASAISRWSAAEAQAALTPTGAAGFFEFSVGVPSGKHTKNYGKSPFWIGKSTIFMAIFNSELLNYQRVMEMYKVCG